MKDASVDVKTVDQDDRDLWWIGVGAGADRSPRGGAVVKRHRWTKVSKVSAGRYEATPAAFRRVTLYPAKCDDCGALVSVATRPSKRGGILRTVEVEVFSMDNGATWSEARPTCAGIRGETRDRALHSEAARDRRRP